MGLVTGPLTVQSPLQCFQSDSANGLWAEATAIYLSRNNPSIHVCELWSSSACLRSDSMTKAIQIAAAEQNALQTQNSNLPI